METKTIKRTGMKIGDILYILLHLFLLIFCGLNSAVSIVGVLDNPSIKHTLISVVVILSSLFVYWATFKYIFKIKITKIV